MSENKRQKEQDKATRHLMDFVTQTPEWASRFDDLITQFVAPVANHFDDDINKIEETLMAGPYHHMAFGYLFEMMATTRWNNETHTPIDQLLQKRGWREGPHGRKYLRALREADLQLLEVTAAESGRWVEVRPHGTLAPSKRVIEHAASESLVQWDCIAARLVTEGKSRRFTGSILPLSREAAQYVQERLEAIPGDLAAAYQEIVAEGDVEGVSVDLVDDIPEERQTRLTESVFTCWAIDVLSERPPPELANTDNERLMMTRFRFPLKTDKASVSDRLSAHPAIVEGNDGRLTWLTSDESRTVLGWMSFSEQHLTFETNSVERGTLGVNLIQSLLGEEVGQPMGLHQTPEALLSAMPADQTPDPDLADIPEVQIAIQQHLTEHYRRTLDESIPMLDNESPRACAADPAKQHKVIDWLKFLENSDQRSSGPRQDLSWMWEELGLSEFR